MQKIYKFILKILKFFCLVFAGLMAIFLGLIGGVLLVLVFFCIFLMYDTSYISSYDKLEKDWMKLIPETSYDIKNRSSLMDRDVWIKFKLKNKNNNNLINKNYWRELSAEEIEKIPDETCFDFRNFDKFDIKEKNILFCKPEYALFHRNLGNWQNANINYVRKFSPKIKLYIHSDENNSNLLMLDFERQEGYFWSE